ncbi:MAG: trigger factor [Clostridia bacterium]|nr:trigger factor [Clostridia bacterium]
MNAKVEKLENSQVKIEITIEAEKFEEAMQKAFFRNAKHFAVPGFRKGKAPRNIVERHYGESILYEEAFNIAAPDVYDEVIKENNIEAVASPEIDITQIGSGKDLVFTAVVTVKPEIKLGKYKGLKVEKKDYPVTDKEIDEHIKQMAEKNARIVSADKRHKLKNGDTAVIDFEGFVDGVPFEGGKAEGHSLEIGSGAFIPGFEDQLVGMKIEEEKEIEVTFPEEYFSQELAGKPAIFKVKLNEIKMKELPEIDDEFAKDVSEFDTLAELKEDVKEHIQEENEKRAKFEEEEEAIKAILDKTEVEIPRVMVDNEIDGYIKDLETRLSYQGLKLDMYLDMMGKNILDVRKEYEEKAENNVKTRLVLEEIFKKEELEVKEEDVNEKLAEFAKSYGRDADEFVKNATEQMKEYVKEELKYTIAVKFIMANVK